LKRSELEMLNMNKIYTVKSNAVRDLKKAIAKGDVTGEDLEVVPADGGFKISKIVPEKPKATRKPKAAVSRPTTPPTEPESISATEKQRAFLDALTGVNALTGMQGDEMVGIWFPFADIHSSSKPFALPKSSVPGLTTALTRRGLIRTAWGDDYIGKHVSVVCFTPAGVAALNAS
jgi:hypothetical protein